MNLLDFTPIAYASVDTFVRKVNTFFINPLIVLLVTVAVAYFLYGVFEFVKNSNSDEGRTKGKNHMVWGLIGLFIMVSVFFIMQLLLGTIGIDESQINVQTGEINLQQN